MSDATATLQVETQSGHPSLAKFLEKEGRLPFVTDEVKPWHYPGWIVAYIQLCEAHPEIPPRYDYVMRTIEAGELLDEPIPQVRFISEHDLRTAEGKKMLNDMVKIIDARTGYSRSFEKLVRWLGFGLGVDREPVELNDEIQELLYRKFDISRWLLNPTDYLGEYMAEDGIGKAAAFYPTPMNVCTMMAMMTHGDGDDRVKKAMDCCVGTGRLLLASSNYCLRLFGQDINWMCVMVSKINLAIYAPWHLIPKSFFPADAPRPETPIETPVYTTEMGQLSLF